MWVNIRKFLHIIFTVFTVIMLFIAYKKIEFPFVLQFGVGYLVFALVLLVDFIITVFFNVIKLKRTIIIKMIFRFIISFFVIWSLTVLLIYINKGELKIMGKLFSSITISFFSTFGSLLYEKKKSD